MKVTYKMPCPVYNWCELRLMLCSTRKEVQSEWKKRGGKDTVRAFSHMSEKYCEIVLTSRLAELQHECIHAANFILKESGVKTTQNNDEALTYLADTIRDWAVLCKADFLKTKRKRH